MSERLLKVEGLKTHFHTDQGLVKAVDGVTYDIHRGEIVGLVGESGCGKSVSQLSIMQLIPSPPGEIVAGEVFLEGRDLLKFKPHSDEMRAVRGGQISMIFQEPMTSLNPVLTIERQMTEALELHLKMDRRQARERACDLLKMMGISDAESRINSYPHQYSGGMRQRIMIAMALSCNPKMVIADEPTTALDVTTQAQVLRLMADMVKTFKSALLIVTHNLGVVARYAQRIYVMYAGRIVESGAAKDIFSRPQHPYTIGLLKSVPRLDEPKKKKLVPIAGALPNLVDMPPFCAFLPRCPYANQECRRGPWPPLRIINNGHEIACRVDVRGS